MSRPLALTTVFANLTGTQPISLLDGDLAQIVAAINDPVSYSNYALDTGTTNVLVATFNPAVTSLTAGLALQVKVLNTNTGASTLNANGTGAKSIVQQSGSAVIAGQLQAGGLLSVIYDGTNYVMISSTGAVSNVVTIAFTGYTGLTGSTQYNAAPSQLQVFLFPPPVVASAGGAGNQIQTGTVNGVAGSLQFNKTTHGLRDGDVVQITTSNTLPGGVSLSTSYIACPAGDSNNFGLYAVPTGWKYTVPLLNPFSNTGGLPWGNPIAFTTAGVGNQTVTPGWVAPSGVTRVKAQGVGGGASGAGGTQNNDSGGGGGAGAFSSGWFLVTAGTFYPIVIGAGGAAVAATASGNAGSATTFFGCSCAPGQPPSGGSSNGGLGGAAGTGGTVNTAGGDGTPGFLQTGITNSGNGGGSFYGGGATSVYGVTGIAGRVPGSGGSGGGSQGASQAGSGAGAAGIVEIEW